MLSSKERGDKLANEVSQMFQNLNQQLTQANETIKEETEKRVQVEKASESH